MRKTLRILILSSAAGSLAASACGGDTTDAAGTGQTEASVLSSGAVVSSGGKAEPDVEPPPGSASAAASSGDYRCDLDAARRADNSDMPDGATRDVLFVSGSRETSRDGEATVTADPAFLVEVGEQWRNVSPHGPGDYVLEILDTQGRVSKSLLFAPLVAEEDSSVAAGEHAEDGSTREIRTRESWVLVVEDPPAVGGYRICDDSETIVEIFASANEPTVEIISPTEGQVFDGDTVEFSWSASDADQDRLTYVVGYSVDGGSNYAWYAPRSSSELAIERQRLQGSDQARIRVIASDGVHSVAAESPIFAVVDREPDVLIESLVDGQIIAGDRPVFLEARAYDSVDGVLDPGLFSWSSDISGDLAAYVDDSYGGAFAVTGLEEGVHRLTVEASNSTGLKGTATVTVTVKDDSDPPIAADDSASASVGETIVVDVILNDTEAEGGLSPDSLLIVEPPMLGTAGYTFVDTNPRYTYALAIEYTATTAGEDRLTYEICGLYRNRTDGGLPCSTAELTIWVTNGS